MVGLTGSSVISGVRGGGDTSGDIGANVFSSWGGRDRTKSSSRSRNVSLESHFTWELDVKS